MNRCEEGINGNASVLVTERAVEELRHGRAIALGDGDRWALIAAIETLEAPLFDRLRQIDTGKLQLILTAQRAEAAGLAHAADEPTAVALAAGDELDALHALAGLAPYDSMRLSTGVAVDGATIDAALRLMKLARLLPAVLMVYVHEVADPNVLRIGVADVPPESSAAAQPIELVSRANVPLVDALDCEMALFRQRGAVAEHLAILLGHPDLARDVPVRLHSACLTGDVMGSLRCDCGDQLKRAINRIAALGGGVLLYLDQEGRGIGLANKLRAYALQDAGLDTVDADQHLGFLPDERDYAVAAAVLHELGIRSIRLLTNNPTKISALEGFGIEVTGRIPLIASVNAYNQRYLKAKLDRAGHLGE